MQNAYFSTSLFVYSSLQLIRDPKSFSEFCNSCSISRLIWQLDWNEFSFFEKKCDLMYSLRFEVVMSYDVL